MSLFQPIEWSGESQPSVPGLTLSEVAQVRSWAEARSQATGDLYRAEAHTAADGAMYVAVTTPSSREDMFVAPGEANWQLKRSFTGFYLTHPVTGGILASFGDMASALAELQAIEDGLTLMRNEAQEPPGDILAVA
ncbi:hypothetical protein [Roseomonas chloroacetimidivorans]|uniref:hypothetical protein n=1 Tax=Roseomonas chloroacetimidivorans TaxID=1766656 RepID=UPI003C71C190